ncbi:DUF6609 family protein [Candidatus Pristimantibacillus sp. PTI5]|uniref:DUF6609 family protein n=1 Tax=Candidatus Pristimantibacillus sp. PTI5 TaxID=3400422 RepID=UPI003B0187AD
MGFGLLFGVGYVNRTITFSTIGYLDAFVKIFVGIVLLSIKKPKKRVPFKTSPIE